jgi:hypothetical protein
VIHVDEATHAQEEGKNLPSVEGDKEDEEEEGESRKPGVYNASAWYRRKVKIDKPGNTFVNDNVG